MRNKNLTKEQIMKEIDEATIDIIGEFRCINTKFKIPSKSVRLTKDHKLLMFEARFPEEDEFITLSCRVSVQWMFHILNIKCKCETMEIEDFKRVLKEFLSYDQSRAEYIILTALFDDRAELERHKYRMEIESSSPRLVIYPQ